MARPAAEILDERARGRAADLLIGRAEKADRASDRGAEARGIAKRPQGQLDAALNVITPGRVEAVAVASHQERVRPGRSPEGHGGEECSSMGRLREGR